MTTLRSMLILGTFMASISYGQIISIKTVPLATGGQFSLFPSANLASGGISVAADDELVDPFVNPARGHAVEGVRVFSAPQIYSISIQRGTNEGSGRALPLGLLMRQGEVFGGLSWARQRLTTDRNSSTVVPAFVGSGGGLPESPAINTYTFALFGGTIPGTDVIVGASVLWGELNAVEGVQLLFPRSPNILQNGTVTDIRVGAVRNLEDDQRIEAVFVRSMFDMQYDVAATGVVGPVDNSLHHFTREYDETNLWGLQIRYTRPVAANWRAGASFTTNWKVHPKIPNYELMSIPRDPGSSTAYNLGIGVIRSREYSFIGFDLIYEPIETETWAEAASPIVLSPGNIFPAGMKTVENFFSFSNWIGRIGFRSGREESAFQAGLQFHTIRYDLEQINHLQWSKRYQREHWTEWTLSAGYGFSVGPAKVLYCAQLTTGTGQPTVLVSTAWTGTMSGAPEASYAADFIPAPGGSLRVREAYVWAHTLSVSFNIE